MDSRAESADGTKHHEHRTRRAEQPSRLRRIPRRTNRRPALVAWQVVASSPDITSRGDRRVGAAGELLGLALFPLSFGPPALAPLAASRPSSVRRHRSTLAGGLAALVGPSGPSRWPHGCRRPRRTEPDTSGAGCPSRPSRFMPDFSPRRLFPPGTPPNGHYSAADGPALRVLIAPTGDSLTAVRPPRRSPAEAKTR